MGIAISTGKAERKDEMIAYGNTIPVVALVRSGVIKKAESIVVLMLVLSNSFELKSEENLIMQVTAKVDLGEDLGQNFGSIFEGRDADGRVVIGAGFSGNYNTHFRMDRYTLQFFVRDDEAELEFEKLPPPSDDAGNYLFDYDGRIYQNSHHNDRTARWWDVSNRSWQVDESFGVGEMVSGEGKMQVGGHTLQFKGGEVWCDGQKVLTEPDGEDYHHFYYALGHLFFFNNFKAGNEPRTRLHAILWVPGDGAADLSKSIPLELQYAGETPFSIGQLGDEVVNSSNMGGVYGFDGKAWKIIRNSLRGVSFQLYSMLNWYDKLLIAQYPTGNLFEYDGKELRHLEDAPPVMAGVSDQAREAQTTGLYGGDLYVGVWPWSELWKYSAHGDSWKFIKRMFERPEITDEMVHPYEDRIRAYNEAHEEDIVWNSWGQRVTGLTPMGDALYLSVSAKGCPERDMRLEFLHDDSVYDQYRSVFRVTKPGCISAPIKWTGKPIELQFRVTESEVTILQDGQILGSAAVRGEAVSGLKGSQITWGTGMFGSLKANLQESSVE